MQVFHIILTFHKGRYTDVNMILSIQMHTFSFKCSLMNCTATLFCHQLGNSARKRSILIFLAALIKE